MALSVSWITVRLSFPKNETNHLACVGLWSLHLLCTISGKLMPLWAPFSGLWYGDNSEPPSPPNHDPHPRARMSQSLLCLLCPQCPTQSWAHSGSVADVEWMNDGGKNVATVSPGGRTLWSRQPDLRVYWAYFSVHHH